MPEKPVLISSEDVAPGFTSDIAVITSPALVDGLIHDQANVLSFLAEEAAPVEVSELSIDALGRVVVRNQAFIDALRQKLEQEASNGICGWRCSSL
ncbi:MAG: hypothetical protein LC808_04215 [Actinobacteria bacterium]|nr:hypothetical protein [Actinomycetota bacterium]